jgi:hypothetical protein
MLIITSCHPSPMQDVPVLQSGGGAAGYRRAVRCGTSEKVDVFDFLRPQHDGVGEQEEQNRTAGRHLRIKPGADASSVLCAGFECYPKQHFERPKLTTLQESARYSSARHGVLAE